MSELRVDAFTGRRVIVAPQRRGIGGSKPGGLPAPSDRRCPFCPGHEADTEATLARWPDEGAWQVRVVANKYPVVAAHFEGAPGRHEVLIESPAHDADLADLSDTHLSGLLGVWQARVRALEADPNVAAVLVFRNRGRRAGSSQPHPHGQIAATGWVPGEVALRWTRAQAHLEETGETLHASELRRELDGPRLLHSDEHVASFSPFAPSRPLEVRFAPRVQAPFLDAPERVLVSLARQLGLVARALRERTSARDFNLVLRLPPARARGPAATWHLDFLPRTGGDAGYELAGGEMIVVVAPEASADLLRG